MLSRPEPVVTLNAEPCPVYFIQPQSAPEVEREAFSAFDQLLNELEQDRSSAEQLKIGRKWVAESFYNEKLNLSSLRLAAGLSQKQLGELCDLEQPHVSRYESGKIEPSLRVSVVMAKALSVDLDLFASAWANSRDSYEQNRGVI